MMSALNTHLKSFKAPKECKGTRCFSHTYANIFNVLIKITSRVPVQASSSLVETIFRVFNDIEENLDNQLAVERVAESQRIAVFEELEEKLERQINRAQRKIGKLGQKKAALQQQLNFYNESFNAAVVAENQAVEDQAAVGQQCTTDDQAFDLANWNLSQQITVCGQTVYLLTEHRELIARFN